MRKRLDLLNDLFEVAVKCGFRLGKMAKEFQMSERTLRRRIREQFGMNGREWRDAERLKIALASLQRGDQVKAASTESGFKHRESCSTFVKRQTGSFPSQLGCA